MYQVFESTTLSSGEVVELGVVLAPDSRWQADVLPLLSHKPGNFQWHFDRAFQGAGIEGLETRFYIAVLDGHPVSNIMTVEYDGIGIVGHVYTVPDHRRKGACRTLMARQMADFRERGGRYLTLGTGYGSHPYRIYESFHFEGVLPDSGFMRYATNESFEGDHFAILPTHIVEPMWHDWPVMNVLCAQTSGPVIRNMAFELFGARNFEGGYLTFLRGIEEDSLRLARLLKSSSGAVVGYVTVQPDRRWAEQNLLLDLHLHPAFIGEAHSLLRSLPFPQGVKIQCWTEADNAWKIAALLEEGFVREATLMNQLNTQDGPIDAEVYALS